MLMEVTGVCQHCKAEVKVLLLNSVAHDKCSACNNEPFSTRLLKGLVYIVANPYQEGVKVGLTTKTIESRLKSLNSTGVAGSFVPIAIFPSQRPEYDEKRVHDKLHRYNIAKEHFMLTPVDAVLGAYRALNKRRPIFFDTDIEEKFHLKLQQAKIEFQLKIKGN